MCGRTALWEKIQNIKDLYQTQSVQSDFSPSYNIGPQRDIPTVKKNSPLTIQDMTWNFLPKEANRTVINARSETISEKKLFQESWENGQRCLIPVNGFYEWKNKQPFFFRRKDKKIFSLAGIYRKTDEGFNVAILTENATSFIRDIHDRQPVIIKQSLEDNYLDKGLERREKFDFEDFEKYPVTKKMSDSSYQKKNAVKKMNSLGDF